jgi:hypothetical protein
MVLGKEEESEADRVKEHKKVDIGKRAFVVAEKSSARVTDKTRVL